MSAQLPLFSPRDQSADWQVRVSRRARRLSVRVYPGGHVEIVAPPGASAMTVQRFIGQHRDWIDRRVEDLRPRAAVTTRPTTLDVRALDRTYVVEYRDGPGPLRVRADGEHRLIVSGDASKPEILWRMLRRWLLELAHDEFTPRLTELGADLKLRFRRVQIRRQRTRWGSCSVTGTISLNVCLLFLPPAVVRYLFVHELCHTRHMNHSTRFWSLVESHEADYKQLDRELTRGWRHVPGWLFA